MFSLSNLFKGPQPTVGCQRWSEFVPPEFIYLTEGGPSPPDVEKQDKWLRSYARWRVSYEGFVKNEQELESSALPQEETDRRHREAFVALYLHSGQWHAILLMLVKDVPEPERAKHLGEIDGTLVELRKRIANGAASIAPALKP